MGQWENNYTDLYSCYQTENSRFHFASLILGSRHLPDLPQLVESHLQQLQLDVGQATQPQALRSDLVIHWSRKWGSGLYHVVSICMQKKCIDLQVVTSRGRVCPCLPCCNCSNPLTNSNQTTRAIRLYLGSAKVSAQSAALAFGVERLPCWVEFLHNEGSSHIFGGMESS